MVLDTIIQTYSSPPLVVNPQRLFFWWVYSNFYYTPSRFILINKASLSAFTSLVYKPHPTAWFSKSVTNLLAASANCRSKSSNFISSTSNCVSCTPACMSPFLVCFNKYVGSPVPSFKVTGGFSSCYYVVSCDISTLFLVIFYINLVSD